MDMLFSFKNKYHYTYLNTYILPPACPTLCALWNDYKGVCEGGTPSEGVSNGSVGS